MDSHSVENVFIEMIQPKIDEIKKRFSQSEPLTQEDINTLLLQSQYNYINHLDERLSSLDIEVRGLKTEFLLMEERVNTKFEQVNTKIEQVNARVERLQSALIKSMIVVMGGLLTIFKIIDLFIK